MFRRLLSHQISKEKKTSSVSAELSEKRNSLQRRIDSWRLIQDTYMPCVSELRAQAIADGLSPESAPLHLPSSISPSLHKDVAELVEKEKRIRIAQADDALRELQHLL
jgi:hypothetical protein